MAESVVKAVLVVTVEWVVKVVLAVMAELVSKVVRVVQKTPLKLHTGRDFTVSY